MEWVGVAVFSDRSGQYAPVTRHFERHRDTSKEGERGCRMVFRYLVLAGSEQRRVLLTLARV